MSAVFPWAVAFLALLVLFIRTSWRNTVIRKSMNLSDDIVKLLSRREVIWLRRGLTEYLGTPEGATIAEDPRVVHRLALFEKRLQESRDGLARVQRTRALRATCLPELPAEDGLA